MCLLLRGSQYVSILYIKHLAQVETEPLVDNRGESDDNALGEMINGLNKAELVQRDWVYSIGSR